MLVKVTSKNKKLVIGSKKYIGAGLYKDDNNVVWELSKEGDDWIIKRKFAKKGSIYSKGYWERVFNNLVNNIDVKYNVHYLTAFVNENQVDFTSEIEVDLQENDDSINLELGVNITKDEVDGKYVILIFGEVNGDKFEVYDKLPEEIGLMLDAFETDEVVEIMSEVIQSEDFIDYVINLLKDNSVIE